MHFREHHYRWEFDLNASPERLWPFVADTNRFNRDTGVPKIDMDTSDKRLPNARRRVRLSIYGLPIEWEEQPFEWVKPSRFGVERAYSRGPMARMKALAELTAKENGGTHLTYDVWATPRNLLGEVFIPLQIKLVTSPKLRAAFQKYDHLALAQAAVQPPLSESAPVVCDEPRLNAVAQKLRDDVASTELSEPKLVIVDQLVEFIRRSDDFGVARIRPYQLADEWQAPRRMVLEICLRATRLGLLDFQWELLCPLCRGAQQRGLSLKDITTEVHCSTCKIDFTVNFDRFVELTFRPNPAVRRIETKDFCIGSPERTPHVVAQQLLPKGEKRSLSLPLEAGNYRLRALELQGSTSVAVNAEGETSVPVVISHDGWVPSLTVAERCAFELDNTTEKEQLLILERLAWSDQATTAAEVTALQMFRDLFSTEALRPGEQISVGTLTVLFTDLRHSTRLYREIGDATAFGRVMNHFDVLKKAIAERDGAVVKTIGDAVMAVFRRPSDGLFAMLEAQQLLANPVDGSVPLQLKAGLHSGPCIAVTLNERLDYFGSTVNMAARLEALSTGADVIISRSVFEDTDVRQLLTTKELAAEEFDISLKGFDDERFELWRVSRTT
jgi:adenylate cyclase